MTLRDTPRGLRQTYRVELSCRRCGGAGEIHGERCPRCDGAGVVWRERPIPDQREED